MKRVYDNERGIALVMALILSLIVLATVSALLYLITQGTVMSGYQKRYETSLEAARGGVDLVTKEVLLTSFGVWSGTTLTSIETTLTSHFNTLNLLFNTNTSSACMMAKLTTTTMEGGTDNWANAGCTGDNESSLLKKSDGTNISDMQFTLQGPTSAQNYNVYAKIVDTLGCNPGGTTCPNTSISGLDLAGGGVVESGSGMVTPKHVPFMYRIEVQAERQNNPDEHSNLSVLYAF